MITLLNQLGSGPVSKYETKEYHRSYITEYKNRFIYFKHKEIIMDENFENNKWSVITGVDRHNIVFDFNEIQFMNAKSTGKFSPDFDYEDLILSVKGFTLYQLDFYASSALKRFTYALARILNENVLAENKLPEKFQEDDWVLSVYKLLKEYFMFIEPYYSNEELLEDMGLKFFEFIRLHNEKTANGEYKRALPSIETMFKFNDIIQDFINTPVGDDKEKRRNRERFFPIILWWKITTIIPMRTQEFTVVPMDCLQIINGLQYFKFYRNDIKGKRRIRFDHSFEACFREENFPINDEIKALIEEYQNLVNHYDHIEDFYRDGRKGKLDRKFLLSYRSYKRMLRLPQMTQVIDDREFLSSSQLRSLLNLFLIDIVADELGIEIIPKSKFYGDDVNIGNQLNDISIMDTRHYAIMNMIFMGYEASTVQRIVGHNRISQSLSYFDHPEQFVKGYIISAAKLDALRKNSMRKNMILNMKFDEIFGKDGSGNERLRRFKAKQSDPKNNYKKLTNGICTYEGNDMLPCKLLRGTHERCRFFSGGRESIPSVTKEFDAISEEISAEIQTLRFITKNIKTLLAFKEQYNVSLNKLRSKMLNQAEIISDYYICGVEEEV